MLGESGMHLDRPYEGILCNNDVWRYDEVFARLLNYIIDDCSSCIAPPLWYVLGEKLKSDFVLTHTHPWIDSRHPGCRKLSIFSKNKQKHLAVINYFSTTPQTIPHSEIHQWGGTSLPLLKVGYIEYLCQAVSDFVQPSFCCARQKWSSGQAYRDRVKSCLFLNKVGLEVLCSMNRPPWHVLLHKSCREIREIGWW